MTIDVFFQIAIIVILYCGLGFTFYLWVFWYPNNFGLPYVDEGECICETIVDVFGALGSEEGVMSQGFTIEVKCCSECPHFHHGDGGSMSTNSCNKAPYDRAHNWTVVNAPGGMPVWCPMKRTKRIVEGG